MDQFIIDGLRKNQEDIDDLINDNNINKEYKEKLISILNKERDMLKDMEDYYKEKDKNEGDK